MKRETSLQELQGKLEAHYARYAAGEISQEEYLRRIKPLDEAIDNMEMATLRNTPAWKRRSSSPLHSPENQTDSPDTH